MNELLYTIIIGGIAGFLAGLVMKGGGFGIILNIIVGIIGGWLGSYLFGKFGITFGLTGISLSLVTAFIGAVILPFIVGIIQKVLK